MAPGMFPQSSMDKISAAAPPHIFLEKDKLRQAFGFDETPVEDVTEIQIRDVE